MVRMFTARIYDKLNNNEWEDETFEVGRNRRGLWIVNKYATGETQKRTILNPSSSFFDDDADVYLAVSKLYPSKTWRVEIRLIDGRPTQSLVISK